MKVGVKIQNGLEYDLKMYQKKQHNEIRKAIDQLITQTEIEATRDAPKFVSVDKRIEDNGFTGRVGVIGNQSAEMGQSDPNNLAAYFEFGTGLSAREILAPYPQWVKDIARQYFVSGQGTLIGKPYLFNNFLKNHIKFEKQLKALLKEKEQ